MHTGSAAPVFGVEHSGTGSFDLVLSAVLLTDSCSSTIERKANIKMRAGFSGRGRVVLASTATSRRHSSNDIGFSAMHSQWYVHCRSVKCALHSSTNGRGSSKAMTAPGAHSVPTANCKTRPVQHDLDTFGM